MFDYFMLTFEVNPNIVSFELRKHLILQQNRINILNANLDEFKTKEQLNKEIEFLKIKLNNIK